MTRTELYNGITSCGQMSYTALIYAISNTTFSDPSLQLLLLGRVSQVARLSREDWILFAKSVTYQSGSPITGDTVASWLASKNCLTAVELKTWLNYIVFTDSSEPTYLLTESGDIVLAE